jgi:hypothetical protein
MSALLLLLNDAMFLLSIILFAGLLFLLYFTIKGIIRWKSLLVGLQVPLIIILIMTAWSCGFSGALVSSEAGGRK